MAPRNKYPGLKLLSKAAVATLLVSLMLWFAPMLGPTVTFVGLDILLATYLVSLFDGRARYLCLLHPIFVLVSSFGFGMPYNEIGVSYTYHQTFDQFIDPVYLSLDFSSLVQAIFYRGGEFGFSRVYVGVIPIIMLPKLIFGDVPDIINYYSLSVFTVLYAAIGATVALALGSMRKDLLLAITLYATVSPTFLEINSSMHRYGMLYFGLFLVLVAYMGFLQRNPFKHRLILLVVMLIGLVFVTLSKAPLLLSLIVFLLIERFSANKLFIISNLINRCDRLTKIMFLLLSIVLFQFVGQYIAPEKYVTIDSQQGGKYTSLSNMPIIGLVLRVVYAALSPFPLLGFSQWDLYGDNALFLGVHLLSAVLAVWIVMSVFRRLTNIVHDDEQERVIVCFGLGILASLTFSAIGYHVYIAPALPFLAVALLRIRTRIPWHYAVSFVGTMEIIANMARVVHT